MRTMWMVKTFSGDENLAEKLEEWLNRMQKAIVDNDYLVISQMLALADGRVLVVLDVEIEEAENGR